MSAPAEKAHRPVVPTAAVFDPAVADPGDAIAWLDCERANLVASCAYTTAHGLPDHATRLAATLFRYFDFGGYYGDALAVHSHALRAARMMASPAAEAEALTNLGGVHWPRAATGRLSSSSSSSSSSSRMPATALARPSCRPTLASSTGI